MLAGEIVHPAALDATRQSMICAQCHSLRDMLTDRYVAGEDYFDHFMPILEYAQKPGPDPAWWADGRPRRFSNDALGFWMSACYAKGGASCLSCHSSAHLPNVDGPAAPAGGGNTSCVQCHADLGRNVAAHTRHRPDGPGSSCVECHMPKEVFSLRGSAMRDHTIGVPVPREHGALRDPQRLHVLPSGPVAALGGRDPGAMGGRGRGARTPARGRRPARGAPTPSPGGRARRPRVPARPGGAVRRSRGALPRSRQRPGPPEALRRCAGHPGGAGRASATRTRSSGPWPPSTSASAAPTRSCARPWRARPRIRCAGGAGGRRVRAGRARRGRDVPSTRRLRRPREAGVRGARGAPGRRPGRPARARKVPPPRSPRRRGGGRLRARPGDGSPARGARLFPGPGPPGPGAGAGRPSAAGVAAAGGPVPRPGQGRPHVA